jgi:glyoxylase-like metal-dependent hydrolase (beta-lactamase superfamily II)
MAREFEPRVVKAANRGPFTLDGTRTFLVGRERVAVIDPGPDAEVHVRALSRALEGAAEIRILLTHGHPDHSGAAAPLSRLVDATILASPLLRSSRAEEGPAPPLGEGMTVLPLGEGDVVSTDQGALVVVDTPGHSRDHLAFHWKDCGAVFVGDLLLGKGTTTWVGEYPGCVREYLASLRKLRGLAPRVLYPSHGPPLASPGEALSVFESHRLQRIEQVRRARLSHPQAGPGELVRIVYGDSVPARMAKAARSSVEVMLHHLREEG